MTVVFRRFAAVGSSLALMLAIVTVDTNPAAAVTEEDPAGTGDAIYGDTPPETAAGSTTAQSRVLTQGLTIENRWTPAIFTGAVTAAYIAEDTNTVYQASRSSTPSYLYANNIQTGASKGVTELSVQATSWDMAVSGDLLAVGPKGGSASKPRLLVRRLQTSGAQGEVIWDAELPATTKTGAYIFSIVADIAQPGLFWLGTYDSGGARLYSFDAETGGFTDYTPGSSWSARGLKYVRSLTQTTDGLYIGLGNPGFVWVLRPGARAPEELPAALGGLEVSMVYSLASVSAVPDPFEPVLEEAKAGEPTLVVAGTDSPAAVVTFDSEGTVLNSHLLSDASTAVDRIAVDDQGTAWFTVRPTGDLYSLDLNDINAEPQFRTETVLGSETRAISVHDGLVRGVTGMRDLWTFSVSSGRLANTVLASGTEAEPADHSSQGVLAGPGYTLVGGHWRYQAHTGSGYYDIPIPGEPKDQILVGNKVYASVYPYAAVFEVNATDATSRFIARTRGQTRPRALTHNHETGKLYMASSSPYGSYGGAITVVDPANGSSDSYDTPVQNQMPYVLAPIGTDLLVGTSPAGEAVSAPAGARPAVVRWDPTVPSAAKWTTYLQPGSSVWGVTSLEDDAGEFVFATTYGGIAYALDGETGEILWTTTLPGTGNSLRAVGNYVVLLSGNTVVEAFPSRSFLTLGLTLAQGVRWMDLQGAGADSLDVALVTLDSESAERGTITNPRQVKRIGGENRVQTAVAVSGSSFESSRFAVIATGRDFPDALAAGPLAASLDAPVLLNSGDSLTAPVREELKRLDVETVYIAGGPKVVPALVESQIRKQGYNVKRLSGENRYQTSLAVAEEIRRLSGKQQIPVLLTTGKLFPDALSATPAAAEVGGAILLTRHDKMDTESLTYVRSNRVSYIATVGGAAHTAAKSARLSPQWNASGEDRYQTSALVAQKMFPNSKTVYVATGLAFPDGLTAGPAASRSSAPVILTKTNQIPGPTRKSLNGAAEVVLVGGASVLSDSLAKQIRMLPG